MLVKTTQLALFQTLRCDEQMYAQRTADRANANERLHDLGFRLQQFGEFVDHDQ